MHSGGVLKEGNQLERTIMIVGMYTIEFEFRLRTLVTKSREQAMENQPQMAVMFITSITLLRLLFGISMLLL